MSSSKPPTPPQPASGTAASGGMRSRRYRRASADDVLRLAAEQRVDPPLQAAMASHEVAAAALSDAPRRTRRHSHEGAYGGGSSSAPPPPRPQAMRLPSPSKRQRDANGGGGADASAPGPPVPMWDGDDLEVELPDSPCAAPLFRKGAAGAAAGGGLRAVAAFTRGQSWATMLPSPTPSSASAATSSMAGGPTLDSLDSPFSPTKKLRAMSLRSGSSLSVMEEEPLRPGEILSTSAHRLRQAMTLYEVHSGMGGKLGAAFAAVLRREFPSMCARRPREIFGARGSAGRLCWESAVGRARERTVMGGRVWAGRGRGGGGGEEGERARAGGGGQRRAVGGGGWRRMGRGVYGGTDMQQRRTGGRGHESQSRSGGRRGRVDLGEGVAAATVLRAARSAE